MRILRTALEWLLVVTVLVISPAFCDTVKSAEGELSVNSLQTRREQIVKSSNIDESLKEQVLKEYDSAIADAQLISQIEKECVSLEEDRKNAPAEMEKVRQKISQLKNAPESDVSIASDMSLEDVQKYIGQLKIDIAQATSESDKIEAESKRREEIRQLEPQKKKELENQLDETKKEFEKLDKQNLASQLADATRYALQMRQKKLQEQQNLLGHQLTSFDTTADLIKAEKEFLVLKMADLKKKLEAWQDVSSKKETGAARAVALQIRRDLQQLKQFEDVTQIAELAENTIELSKELEGEHNIFTQNKIAEERLKFLQGVLDRVKRTYELTQKKVESVGLTEPVGIVLRRQLAMLPVIQNYRSDAQKYLAKLDSYQLTLMEYQEELDDYQDMDGSIEEYINGIKPAIPDDKKPEVASALKKLFTDRKKMLVKLAPVYEQYVKNLENIQMTTDDIVTNSSDFRDYIEARLLWIKSNEPMKLKDLTSIGKSLHWLVTTDGWVRAGDKLWKRVSQKPVITIFVLLFFGALLVTKRKLTKKLHKINAKVKKDIFSPFRFTVIAIVMTAVLSAILPAIIWIIGEQLLHSTATEGFTSALGETLKVIALIWWPAGFLRMICNPKGLGPNHFRWPEEPCRGVWKGVRSFLIPGLIVIFFATLTNAPISPIDDDALSRTIMMIGLGLLCAANIVLMRPRGVIVRETIGRKKHSWMYKLRYPIFIVVVLIPLVLIVAVFMGYFETAIEFMARLLSQLWLVLLVIVLNSAILRWLLLARRNIVFERRRQRLEEEAREAAESDAAETDVTLDIQPEEMNIAEVHAQTQQIVRYFMAIIIIIGMNMIWSGTFPALRFMSKVTLWTTGSGSDMMTVTLGHLVTSLVILIVMIVVNNNISGMMEIVLDRFKLDSGARYAVSTVARYAVLTVGIIAALQTIGITWKSIQWLVAAVSLGVGFGLQEIVANFVSGLIILFERPIRLGDVVTIGNVTGVVSKIRIRATTITDWSRKELIVPNKDFITGQLVNWTLSDSTLRLNIPVGIAYGSDTALAKQLLVKIAKECPHVIEDPAPYAIFKEFGDSTLNFELRAYIGGMENFVAAWDGMVTNIDNAFRENNIEIAFPQQDLHIRSIETPIPILRGKQSN